MTARTAELVTQFQADHERPPTPLEKLDLAQQASLETSQAKRQTPITRRVEISIFMADLGAHRRGAPTLG